MEKTLEQKRHAGLILQPLTSEECVIRRLQSYIAERLYETITREELANYVHLDSAYLSRLFKKETGMTLSDYMLHERMNIARELLLGSQASVSGIARMLGYSNFSHFSKMFKKAHGIGPQQLRKENKS